MQGISDPAPAAEREDDMTISAQPAPDEPKQFNNKLTAAEAERLAIMAEECAEIVVIVGKILRHGFESFDPTKPESERYSNRDLLAHEVGDVKWIMNVMAVCGDFNAELAAARFHSGTLRKAQWLHHQKLVVNP